MPSVSINLSLLCLRQGLLLTPEPQNSQTQLISLTTLLCRALSWPLEHWGCRRPTWFACESWVSELWSSHLQCKHWAITQPSFQDSKPFSMALLLSTLFATPLVTMGIVTHSSGSLDCLRLLSWLPAFSSSCSLKSDPINCLFTVFSGFLIPKWQNSTE